MRSQSVVATVLAVLMTAPPVHASAAEPPSHGPATDSSAALAVASPDEGGVAATARPDAPGAAGTEGAPTTSAEAARDSDCVSLGTCPHPHVSGDSKPAAAEDDSTQPGPGRPRVFLELTRPAPVELVEVTGYQLYMAGVPRRRLPPPRPVCDAPCGQVIDARKGNLFYVGGQGVTPSRGFDLSQHDGELVARVRPGRYRLLLGSLPVVWLGFAGTVVGGFLVGDTRDQMRVAGGLALGLGVAVLATGITMIVRGVTRVRLRRR
jgi:hypothetical protein